MRKALAVALLSRRCLAMPLTSLAGASFPSLTLNDGTSHPQLGYGTYKVGITPASASSVVSGVEAAAGEAVSPQECVAAALKLGYRFFDCAEFYGNEAAVGEAIAQSGIPREELYIASKCWTSTIHKGPEAVQAQIEKTLRELGIDYLDLYCIHWPVPGKHEAAYKQLEQAQAAGLVRSLGVSNYAVEDLDDLLAVASVTPAVNQIEVNPFLYRKQTIDYFRAKGIQIQSYRSLRDGKAFEDPTVLALAAKHVRTPAQVLGRWCVQHGFMYIPKSVKPQRMEENMQVFDFELDEQDMQQLDALTTPAAIDTFHELYVKCVLRDTPDAVRSDLVRGDITRG